MKRIMIECEGRWPDFRYLDSVHAALLQGFVSAGVPGDFVTGHTAESWTFACLGPIRRGGLRKLSKVLVSSASDRLSEALEKLDPAQIRKTSSNGDVINLEDARIRSVDHAPVSGTHEFCVSFASRFALTREKSARSKTEFVRSTKDTDFSRALKVNLDRRAGRTLDLEIAIDPLTLATEGHSVPVPLRRSGDRRILIPAFNMPVTLRGNPDDLRWAFFAGIGAKTRLGFGCPVPVR